MPGTNYFSVGGRREENEISKFAAKINPLNEMLIFAMIIEHEDGAR